MSEATIKRVVAMHRVCATGMYRSTEHAKFPKFQTGIFVEWKAPKKFKVIKK